MTVSKHKALLERHYIVACTEWAITEQFIDKKRTYALADAIGVPAPRTIVPPVRRGRGAVRQNDRVSVPGEAVPEPSLL
ncbi:MAG: hypothetical protein M5R40_21800 [Anaerolineae bacterium]|nr:hypothetical protein [Anaerolineae bacterium]